MSSLHRVRPHVPAASALGVLLLTGCGSGSGGGPTGVVVAPAATTIPVVTLVGPARVAAGGLGFRLRVDGANLSSQSVVRWNGEDRPTSLVGSRQLIAQIAPADVARAGVARVTVFNPGTGGGNSNAVDVAITTDNESCFRPWVTAAEPAGRFVFVANGGCSPENSGFLESYAVDAATGNLSRLAVPALPIGPRNPWVEVEPRGRFVYASNGGDTASVARISAFAFDGDTGRLTAAGATGGLCPAVADGECFPVSLSFEPSGRFAYAVSAFSRPGVARAVSIAMLEIDPATGLLSVRELTTSSGVAGPLVVDARGRFAYLAAPSDKAGTPGRVVIHAIDPASGALTIVGSAPAALSPAAFAIDPSGRVAIVANQGTDDLSSFAVDPGTGALSALGTIGTARSPSDVLVHPSGEFVYVVSSGWLEIWNYTLDAASGRLGSVGSIAALPYVDLDWIAMTLHPSGKFAYVVVQGSEVQTYAIDAGSGALRKAGRL